jgi:hypothetical protein
VYKKEAWADMPRCKLTVLRKPKSADMEITVHAKRAEPLHFACTFVLKISQVFNLQDKHNASILPKCLDKPFGSSVQM